MSLVSVLLPVYNAAPFLPECLDSILVQDLEDWELIAVDNDSTDDSLAILQSYATKDPRIRVFSNTPNSIILALRLALRESHGTWITRMDADDRMPPQKLSLMQRTLEDKGPGHLATGLVQYFSAGPLGDGYRRYAAWLNALTWQSRNFDDRYKECVIPSPCWMCHREDLLRCGAFDADRYPEDYDLAFRFYRGGLKVVGIPELLHYWRDYSARSSRTSVHYSDNRFLELKVDYFLSLDHDAERPLAIWGAGRKGKRLAQLLVERNIPFHWLTDNAAKIGHVIYGQRLVHFSQLTKLVQAQVVVSVAAPEGQQEIREFWEGLDASKKGELFWFC